MAQAACTINLGVQLQKVFVKTTDTEAKVFYVSLEDMPTFLASHDNIKSFIVKGNKDYVGKIERETKEKELSQYSKAKTKFYYV